MSQMPTRGASAALIKSPECMSALWKRQMPQWSYACDKTRLKAAWWSALKRRANAPTALKFTSLPIFIAVFTETLHLKVKHARHSIKRLLHSPQQ